MTIFGHSNKIECYAYGMEGWLVLLTGSSFFCFQWSTILIKIIIVFQGVLSN